MFKRQYLFTVPEFVEANRKGELSPVQRKRFLWDVILLAAGVVLLAIGGLAIFAAGKSVILGFLMLGSAGLVGAAILEPWQIYKEPRPQIVLRSGVLQLLPNTPVRNGGFVKVGEERVYLSKKQLREVFIGRRYDIFVVVPQNTALSAHMVEA